MTLALSRHGLRLLSLVVALGVACVSAPASAQPRATLNRFRPAPTPEDDFHLSRATDLGHLRFGAQLGADYALNPLVYEAISGDSGSERFAVVEHQLTATIGLSLGLFDRVVIFGGLAFVPVMQGSRDPVLEALGAPRADGAGLGDAYVGARVRLLGDVDELFALALQATVTLPTSGLTSDSSYRGDASVTVLPALIGELRPGAGSRIVLNVGARIREESRAPLANLEFGHELTYGLGFAIPVYTDAADARTHLDALAQIYGDTSFASADAREGTSLEATAGLRFFHESGFVAGLAAGPGLSRGLGTPDLRAIVNVGWVTPATLAAPEQTFADRDGDGIADADDGCPGEAEDFDSFEDADGCPDRDVVAETPEPVGDTDGDGILDDVDACVAQAEDVDGFQDADGCPDSDNDDDGVTDDADRCPLEAGPVANRGCPDTDRDGDTIVDRIDNCPDEPGTAEHHGCRAAQRVTIDGDSLQILDMVFFRTNRDVILARSHALLLNVAAVLNAHPELPLVIVEGHTDARGDREHNIELSQRRAEAVVRFLVERGGVAVERLRARGLGPDVPLVQDASTPDELARNRRVEFRIDGAPVVQRGAQ